MSYTSQENEEEENQDEDVLGADKEDKLEERT